MLFEEQFTVPTKIHFRSSLGSDVGTVVVDRIVGHPGGTSFYFGKSCSAILTDTYLMVGSRRLERGDLSREEPFWHKPADAVR